jgi:NADPH2:quinone reductase
MTANLTLRFVLLYGIPADTADLAVADISTALVAGALSELPMTRLPLHEIAAAHDAVEAGTVGKVVVEIP